MCEFILLQASTWHYQFLYNSLSNSVGRCQIFFSSQLDSVWHYQAMCRLIGQYMVILALYNAKVLIILTPTWMLIGLKRTIGWPMASGGASSRRFFQNFEWNLSTFSNLLWKWLLELKRWWCGDGDREILEEKGFHGSSDGERVLNFLQQVGDFWWFFMATKEKKCLEKMGIFFIKE